MPINEGIREVPADMPIHHRLFFTSLRNSVLRIQSARSPVEPVKNVKVTPVAGGINVQFTRPLDADNVVLFNASSPSLSAAVPTSLGTASSYTLMLAKGGVTNWIWLVANRGQVQSTFVGPFKATTLALGVAATLPPPPPVINQPLTDSSSGHPMTGVYRAGVRISFE